MLNKAILTGRLTRDPELKHTQNNTPVVSFSLAVDRNYGGCSAERQTDFIDIVAWRRTAEFVSQWFKKGQMAIVVGSIQSRRWQDKNGANRVSIEVVADEVQFGESKKSRDNNGDYQGNGYQASCGAPQPDQYGSYGAPRQQAAAPTPRFDMPAGGSDFSEISDDDGEIPF